MNKHGGAVVRVFELGRPWTTQNPFLFCMYHMDRFPKGRDDMSPNASLTGRNIGSDFSYKDGWSMYHGKHWSGFPVHPHRGFETITLVRQGLIDHADSMGAKARFGGGDCQWVTAGSGIQHSEMFPCMDTEKENPMELFQIWLNLPKASKMAKPHFTMLWADKIPRFSLEDKQGNNVDVAIVAGNWNGKHQAPSPPPESYASDPKGNIAIWTLRMEPNARVILPTTDVKGTTRSLYFFLGEKLSVDNTVLDKHCGIELDGSMGAELHNAGSNVIELLMLQGVPIDEPVVQHGPFVMNTRQEIQQTFIDYQQTQFGGWPYDRPDPIHPKTQPRFAVHTDGSKEIPPPLE